MIGDSRTSVFKVSVFKDFNVYHMSLNFIVKIQK